MSKKREATVEELEEGIGEKVVLVENDEVEESADGIDGLKADEEVEVNDL